MKVMKRLIAISSILVCLNTYGQSCSDFTLEHDKFTGVSAYISPSLKSGKASLSNRREITIYTMKKFTEAVVQESLLFLFMSPELEYGGEGAIILLDNGARIDRSDVVINLEISESVASVYRATLILNNQEKELLRKI